MVAAPGASADPRETLEDFRRWPTWMWANTEVAGFTRWLRKHNERLPEDRRVGFFGLDVYSLWESLHAVLDHLRAHDPGHVEHALEAYRCFEPYAEDPQAYARATRLVPSGYEPEVLELLARLRHEAGQALSPDRSLAEFAVRQNAEVLAGAEAYYRAMMRGGPESWNIRDRHMTDTLDRLMAHHDPDARAVVWEHNTHIGDARATDMADAGMVNVGQLVRERHLAEGVVLVGFGSYQGTVFAADFWSARPRVLRVPPALEGSLEHLLHQALPDRFRPGAGVWNPVMDQGRARWAFSPGTTSTGSPTGRRWTVTYRRECRASGKTQDTRRRWFVKVVAMDGPRLSPREQQILAQIESTLSQDKQLERELRTLHISVGSKCAKKISRIHKAALVVLAVISWFLLAAAVRSPTTGPIVAFAVSCVVTLVLGVTAVCVWAHRRRP